MSGLPLLSQSRTVLMITDDALLVYDGSGRMRFVEALPWKSGTFTSDLADAIKAAGNSVLIINDAVEQHYRKEKVPHVPLFDRANVIKRRLNVAFPNYPIKAGLEVGLKKSGGFKLTATKAKGPAEERTYLFAAVPSSEAFARTIDGVTTSGAPLSGYCLLPIESSDMVKDLSRKLNKSARGSDGPLWSVLIGQHRGGGLRQVVIKNGELALTRITPVNLPQDADSVSWCTDVAQEFQATLSYLSRFGYNPEDGLDVIVVANSNLGDQLEGLIGAQCNYHSLTPSLAAQTLGLKLDRNSDDHFADALHAAWVANKSSFIMPLQSREVDRVALPRKVAIGAMFLLTLGVGYFAFMLSSEAQTVYQTAQNYDVAKQQRAKIEQIYLDELERKQKLGIDIKLMKASIDINSKVEAEKVDLLGMLKIVSNQLKSLRIDGLEFKNKPSQSGGSSDANANGNNAAPARDFKMLLKFSFPGTYKPQDGNAELKEFIDRLAPMMPDYKIEISQKLQDLAYTGELTEEAGLTAQARKAEDRFEAEVSITRAVKNDQNTGN